MGTKTGLPKRLLTTAEVGMWLNVSSETVCDWIKRRGVKHYVLNGGQYRLDPADVMVAVLKCYQSN